MKVLKITVKDYCLNFEQLENLFSEFYGKLLGAAQQDADELEKGKFEFGFEQEGFEDQQLITEAESALQCFRLKRK